MENTLNMLRLTPYFLIAAIASLSVACGMAGISAKPYTSQKHGFTITFPSGAKEPTVQKEGRINENDAVYSTTNDNGVYRVKIINWNESADNSKSAKEILIGAGLGSDIPLDPE